ncbi:MAG: acyl carrier protein, partial [Blautia producta]|nr:acyl carrier protein [Blautia producta]
MDTTTNVWDRLLHHIKLFLDLSDEKKIKEEDQLIDLGINSIDYIKIVLVLESEFGFEFDDEALDMN